MIRRIIILAFVFSTSLVLLQCKSQEETNGVKPDTLEVLEVINTHGGAKIIYELPNNENLLFVKAQYTNSKGEEVFKVSSYYNDTIEVDGFNDTLSHTIDLFVVNRSNLSSAPVQVNIKPLKSYIFLVQENISITPDLGGVKVKWTNESKKTVYVYVSYDDGTREVERILSSNKAIESIVLRGLDSVNYDFSTLVEDFSGNKTDKVFNTTTKPLYEELIDKSTWTLVSEQSINGNAWEGLTTNFWDDVVDTHGSPDDNSYFIATRDNNGGILNYPLDIVIDLNKQVIVNRFTTWQRAYWYSGEESQGISTNPYYYQSENVKSFDLYISNDKLEWQLIGKFDIGDPKDEDGNIPSEKITEAIDGHEFNLGFTTTPFRYLKYSITSNYGNELQICASEISLFGLDNIEE